MPRKDTQTRHVWRRRQGVTLKEWAFEKQAISLAEKDGRTWDRIPYNERERYIERAKERYIERAKGGAA